MNRAFFEALDPTARVELLCRLHTMTVELSERLARNSANSSRPPSSDSPFGGAPTAAGSGGSDLRNALKGSAAGGVGATPGTPRKPGKQPGAKGIWRCEALTAERTEKAAISFSIWNVCRAASGLHASCIVIMRFVVPAARIRLPARARDWCRSLPGVSKTCS